MRIIDVDANIGYVGRSVEPPDTLETLIRNMDMTGVDSAVVFSTRSKTHIEDGNRETQEIVEASNGRLKACWLLHPYLDGIQMPKKDDLLALLKKERPAAVRLNPIGGNYILDRFYCADLLEILRSLRIPVLLNYRTCVQNPLEVIPRITQEFPDIPFVLTDVCHSSSMLVRSLLLNGCNVYFTVGYMVGTGELDQLVNEFGADHFLYSSSVGNVQATGLALVYQGKFSNEAKNAIFSGNWERLQEEIKWES